MANVFKTLIKKEFGDNSYYKYFFSYQNLLYQKDYDIDEIENDEVYKDIYDTLKKMDLSVLARKQARLVDTMMTAFSISKSFLLVIAAYLIALWVFISQGFDPVIAKCCVAVMSASFIYKLYEFAINKFCYVDAHIVIIYKNVLEKLLSKELEG